MRSALGPHDAESLVEEAYSCPEAEIPEDLIRDPGAPASGLRRRFGTQLQLLLWRHVAGVEIG